LLLLLLSLQLRLQLLLHRFQLLLLLFGLLLCHLQQLLLGQHLKTSLVHFAAQAPNLLLKLLMAMGGLLGLGLCKKSSSSKSSSSSSSDGVGSSGMARTRLLGVGGGVAQAAYLLL
jgi:hypothetical protein